VDAPCTPTPTEFNLLTSQEGGFLLKAISTGGGTADAITADFTPNVTLSDGVTVIVRAQGANTITNPTFTPDGLTAKTIVKNSNETLSVGDIAGASHELMLKYNSSNDNWSLLNPFFSGAASGSWTPTLWDSSRSDGEGQTYSVNDGTYTKIGNRVFVSGEIIIAGLGTLTTAEQAELGGLPFTPSTTTGDHGGISVSIASGLNITANQSITGDVDTNSTSIKLFLWDAVTGVSSFLISELSNNGSMRFQGQYITA